MSAAEMIAECKYQFMLSSGQTHLFTLVLLHALLALVVGRRGRRRVVAAHGVQLSSEDHLQVTSCVT